MAFLRAVPYNRYNERTFTIVGLISMPKISTEAVDENKRAIEKAALKLFLKRGFNGVTTRQIAKASRMSLGNLYRYYRNKKKLFSCILKNLSEDFLYSDNAITKYLTHCRFPEDMEKLGGATLENVLRYSDYFKMMYIDVVEFDGIHIKDVFSNLDEKFTSVIGARFKEIGLLGPDKSIDPCFAFITVYMGFYQYFILSKIFKAQNLFGAHTEKEVIKKIGQIYSKGIFHG